MPRRWVLRNTWGGRSRSRQRPTATTRAGQNHAAPAWSTLGTRTMETVWKTLVGQVCNLPVLATLTRSRTRARLIQRDHFAAGGREERDQGAKGNTVADAPDAAVGKGHRRTARIRAAPDV